MCTRRAGAACAAALFRSADGGVTWSDVTGAFPAIEPDRVELPTTPARPNSVFLLAGKCHGSTLLGVFRYDDPDGVVALDGNGLVFSSSRIDFGSQTSYDLAIAVDPQDANRLYVAGVRAFQSSDGGATFTELAGDVHVDWHMLVVDRNDPSRILAGNDGGIWMSLDRGATFQSRNYGLSALMFYPGSRSHPTIPGYVLGGLQDNGAIRSGSFNVFEGVSGGDGGFAADQLHRPDDLLDHVPVRRDAGVPLSSHVVGPLNATKRHRRDRPARVRRAARHEPERSHAALLRRRSGSGAPPMTDAQWTAQSADLTKGSPRHRVDRRSAE